MCILCGFNNLKRKNKWITILLNEKIGLVARVWEWLGQTMGRDFEGLKGR